MLNKIYKFSITTALISAPFLVNAQLGGTTTLLEHAYELVRLTLIPLVFTLALLFFFWGMAKYIWSEGQGKEDGRKIMIWGVVALFVMSSVWGIIYFIGEELMPGTGYDNMKIPTIVK